MEALKHLCPGCGSEVPADLINFKTRHADCPWCGLHIVFPKKHSTASPNAAIALEEGCKLFLEGHYEAANNCAKTVLSMVNNNAAALYIESYYTAFVHEPYNSKALDRCLTEVLPDVEFDIEEEEYFKKFLLKTIKHSGEYFTEIIKKFNEYDDAKEFGIFLEEFAPIAIGQKQDLKWFDEEIKEIFKVLAKKVSTPKTWFALYNAAMKNPDSPMSDGSFFLKTKTNRVYNDYILKVDEIFKNIGNEALYAKFNGAFQKVKSAFEAKL